MCIKISLRVVPFLVMFLIIKVYYHLDSYEVIWTSDLWYVLNCNHLITLRIRSEASKHFTLYDSAIPRMIWGIYYKIELLYIGNTTIVYCIHKLTWWLYLNDLKDMRSPEHFGVASELQIQQCDSLSSRSRCFVSYRNAISITIASGEY